MNLWAIILFLVTVFLAYANGANDNFKIDMFKKILLSWILTLPIAALISGLSHALLT